MVISTTTLNEYSYIKGRLLNAEIRTDFALLLMPDGALL